MQQILVSCCQQTAPRRKGRAAQALTRELFRSFGKASDHMRDFTQQVSPQRVDINQVMLLENLLPCQTEIARVDRGVATANAPTFQKQ